MTHEQFERLVASIERRYAGRPAALRRKLMCWLAIGYVVLLASFMFLLLVGATTFTLGVLMSVQEGWFLVGIGAVFLAFAVREVLVLAFPAQPSPEGIPLGRADAPEIFAMLDALRSAIGCPDFHDVRLTGEFNAWVRQVPRLGVFGWSRCSLGIGATLLDALSPEELRAVLAHELSHFSQQHSRVGNHLYQVRRLWAEFFAKLVSAHERGEWRNLLPWTKRFLNWYWPRFNAHAFVLSRQHELAADRLAAELSNREHLALALWKLQCLGRALHEQFWPDLWRLSVSLPDPPSDVLERCRDFFATLGEPAQAERWMELACRAATDLDDTHPCFAERIAALGLDVADFRRRGFPRIAGPSGTGLLLGPSSANAVAQLSRLWQDDAQSEWARSRQRGQLLQTNLERGSNAPAADGLVDPVRGWDLVQAAYHTGGFTAAEPPLRQLLASHPQHGRANLLLGRELLSQGRTEGKTYLERALNLTDETLVELAGQILAEHYREQGAMEAVRAVRQRLDSFAKMLGEVRRAESRVTHTDQFLPHGLSPAEIESLSARLAEEATVAQAWLARKVLPHFPERRLFVLCIAAQPRLNPWAADGQAPIARLGSQTLVPGRTLVIGLRGPFARLGKKLKLLPGAAVYRRGAT